MLDLYNSVCLKCSTITTRSYSTSFSWAIQLLHKSIRESIYSIYGLTRFADEIVDTFHSYNKDILLQNFKKDCFEAIDQGISTNPILQSFQVTVNRYNIPFYLIESFFDSMETDLETANHSQKSLDEYIVGSAEAVGLMCLCVFVNGDRNEYNRLKYSAERLGAAFQKVNFLRDLHFDSEFLGRIYFPSIKGVFNLEIKQSIEQDIQKDFDEALMGIRTLPDKAKLGVFIVYRYYYGLFKKIKRTSPEKIASRRIRISNGHKLYIMTKSFAKIKLSIV